MTSYTMTARVKLIQKILIGIVIGLSFMALYMFSQNENIFFNNVGYEEKLSKWRSWTFTNYSQETHISTRIKNNFEDLQDVGIHLEFDDKLGETILWPDDKECSRMSVRFAMKAPRVFLVSYQRSGNTWTRYMLQSSMGIFSTSTYGHEKFDKLGLNGHTLPPKSGKVMPIKTHSYPGSPLPTEKHTDTVVLLIRNPAHSILSFWSFNLGHLSHTYVASDEEYRSEAFHQFVRTQIVHWEKTYEYRLTGTPKLLVIFYENLLEDPLGEIEKMIRFMGIHVDEKRLYCLSKHIEGPAKRKHPEYMEYYTDEERLLIQNSMARIAILAQNRGGSLPPVFSDAIEKTASEEKRISQK